MGVYVKPINKEYVISMLTLFNKNASVQWKERGDKMPPFTNINITDLLRKFSLGSSSKLDENIIPDVKLLLTVAHIPNGYITNKTIPSQLSYIAASCRERRTRLSESYSRAFKLSISAVGSKYI